MEHVKSAYEQQQEQQRLEAQKAEERRQMQIRQEAMQAQRQRVMKEREQKLKEQQEREEQQHKEADRREQLLREEHHRSDLQFQSDIEFVAYTVCVICIHLSLLILGKGFSMRTQKMILSKEKMKVRQKTFISSLLGRIKQACSLFRVTVF